MSTGTVPIIVCDDEAGCESWEIDYYGMGASVPQLPEGWKGTRENSKCPLCEEEK